MDLGRADAERQEEELIRFFSDDDAGNSVATA